MTQEKLNPVDMALTSAKYREIGVVAFAKIPSLRMKTFCGKEVDSSEFVAFHYQPIQDAFLVRNGSMIWSEIAKPNTIEVLHSR